MDREVKLIILYGGGSGKILGLSRGRFTCGYREYATKFGLIVYMCKGKQNTPWERFVPRVKHVVDLCNSHPNAIVWAVKFVDSSEPRAEVLRNISNFKLYYSCCSNNTFSKLADISLVDTEHRRRNKRQRVWIKGKDPDFWLPSKNKEFDYLLMGRRNDKNQTFFLQHLNRIQEQRSVLWIGGRKFLGKVKSKHHIEYTDTGGADFVRTQIPRARVGVIFSQLKVEGFPQSFLEMTMCGVPVVYGGPRNKGYFFSDNLVFVKKKALLLQSAEQLLKSHDSKKCRDTAIKHYSLDKSFSLLESFR